MQRGRGGLFGSGDPSHGSGVFIQPGKPTPRFFGGSSSFNDPFLTSPSGSMVVPSLFEESIISSSLFETPRGLNGGVMNVGGLQQQVPVPSRTQGPIIEEMSSDDEDDADVNENDGKKKPNPLKHPGISKEPYVEEPEETQDYKRPKHELVGREYARVGTSYQQPRTYMFQSSTVTYGGSNGACYMSSTTRRSDGDGVTVEESKEADTTTGIATHRIARGIGNKGHALTRKLDCDGKVNTMQTLQNLNEDELAGFEESWQRNAGQCLPGWDPSANRLSSAGTFHPGVQEENGIAALPAPSEMVALPSPEQCRGSSSSRMKRLPLNGVEKIRKELPETHRFAAYIALKALSKDRAIKKTDKEHVAHLLKTSLRTVERIWKQANDQIARGEEVDVSIQKKGKCGRKRVDLDLSRISSIPLNERSSLRALARSLDVPHSTLHRRLKWEKNKVPHKQPQTLSITRKEDC